MASPRRLLFAPSGESIGESAVSRRTFFERKNRASAIVVNDWNIEPGPLFEKLQVTLHIGVNRRKADQKEAVGNFHSQAREQHTERLHRCIQQDTRASGEPPTRKTRRNIKHN